MSSPKDRTALLDDARAADGRARRLAQQEFTRPVVVEAGAGTGKTATLVARVLAWCVGPGWDLARRDLAGRPRTSSADIASRVLEGVVAITFTEAAAAEMAERVALGLRGLSSGEPPVGLLVDLLPAAAPDRARALLGVLDGLEVRTIHSFCARLLQTHALTAGLHPAFQVDADGDLVREALEEVVEQALRDGLSEPLDDDLLALATQGVGPQDLVEALTHLVHASVDGDALQGDPLAPELSEALVEQTVSLLGQLADLLSAFEGQKGRSNLRGLGTALVDGLGQLGQAPDIEQLADWSEALLDAHGSALGKLQRADKLSQTDLRVLGEPGPLVAVARPLRDRLRFLGDLDADGLRLVVRVMGPLLGQARRVLHARGLLVFGDLLAGAARLLGQAPELRARLRGQLRQLLVDEFQDTDPQQCQVVGWLALDGPADQRPGLFLVGDPKQSIYGWRSADLAAYEGFVGRVLDAGGQRVSLVVNFRSVPAVLAAVEGAIAPVMREEVGRQPRFEALLPCQKLAEAAGFSQQGRAAVELWATWPWDGEEPDRAPRDKPRKDAVRLVEAAAVARDIRQLHDAGVAWRDFAVLFRASSVLPGLVDALRSQGVPYAVERDRSYFLRREIADAVALVSTVVAPHDQLSLVAWLRSVAVGVPDAALLPLWRRDFPRLMAELQKPSAARLEPLRAVIRDASAEVAAMRPPVAGLERLGGWEQLALDAVERLALCRQSFEDDASDRFVARLRDLSMVEQAESARYLGPWRLANLDRFFRGLQQGLADGGDVQVVLRTLREGLQGSREAEEGRPQEAAQDAVQLMTVHKSKGLGFEHVYLVGLDKGSGGGQGNPDQVHDAGAWRLLGRSSLGLLDAQARAESVGQAEQVRLLYVAMTRAKQRLVLAGGWDPQPPPVDDPDQVDSLIRLLGSWDAVPDDLRARAVALAPDQDRDPAADQGSGVRWVFPDRMQPTEDPERPVATGPGADLPPMARVQRDRQRLERARDEARSRQRRAWSQPASHDAHDKLVDALQASAGDADAALPLLPPGTDGQAVAMAAGSAVHRALELLPLQDDQDPGQALTALVQQLPGLVAPFATGTEADLAVLRAAAILDALPGGRLLARLHAARHHLVARELPLLLPPTGPTGPVAAVTGAIDLVLQDPDSGQLVVIDYKTDQVQGDAVQDRARAYASQARLYARAVAEALQPALPPRAELWFLAADQAVEIAL